MGGCCAVTEEQKANHQINQNMGQNKEADKNLHRILLLGPGDSGKTTLLKQMRKINKQQIGEETCKQYIPHIRQAIISDIRTLLSQVPFAKQLGIDVNLSDFDIHHQSNKNNDENENKNESTTNNNNQKHSEIIKIIIKFLELTDELDDTIDDNAVDDNYIKIMKAIWKFWKENDLSIKPINNSAPYFLDKIDKVYSKDFIPTFDDYLRLRVRTPGFVSETFIKKYQQSSTPQRFQIIDVGGQRSERNKWYHLFEETIQCVLYIVSVGDYDKVIWEDSTTKRLEEALSLFDTVIEKGFFNNREIVIFLNKVDLFKEKLQLVDLSEGFNNFDDFPEEHSTKNWEHSLAYIQTKFTNVYKKYNKSDFGISFHPTCALDTDLVDKLFTEIQFSLVTKQLEKVGV